MLTTKTLAVAIAAVAISSVSVHAAERQTNPLHPAYHAERTVGEFQYLPTQAYVDAGNPLHPSHGLSKVDAGWVGVGAVASSPSYVDSNNPLHPAFKR